MTVFGSVEVGEFRNLPPRPSARQRASATSAGDRTALFGLAGTVILHAITMLAFVPDAVSHKVITPQPESGAAIAAVPDLVFIGTISKGQGEANPFASSRARLETISIPLVKMERAPVLEVGPADSRFEDSRQSAPDPEDSGIGAIMFGRYTGQISARIERAWIKPRSPVIAPGAKDRTMVTTEDTFRCAVEIRQDQRGNVQEVLLLDCNATEAWRHSLVVAINQSSPLPAPPIPAVFKPALTIVFRGTRLSRGRSAGWLRSGAGRKPLKPLVLLL